MPWPVSHRRRWFAAALVLVGLIAGGGLYTRSVVNDIAAGLPPTPDLATLPVSVEVVDAHGQLLRPFTTSDDKWRLPVTPADVDRDFLAMLLGYEDQHFETHHGIDWSSMLRAATQFVGAGGRIVSGGSTLTMQVARLLEQGWTRSVSAKLRQMVHADVLEHQLSKQQILTLYLMLAPYGGNIEGIRAASLAYFGNQPEPRTTAEAALLVPLPQAREARRPDLHPAAARAGRNRVLDRLVSEGLLTAEAAEAAKSEPIPTVRREFPMLAAHLARAAIVTHPGDRRIVLTVDRSLQASLEKLAAARARPWGPKASVAIVVADEASGK